VRTFIVLSIVVAAISPTAATAPTQAPLALPAAPWIDDEVHDGVVHFLFTHPARCGRYDLETKSWLPAITLPQTPAVFAINDDGIFVGFRSGLVSRFDHAGGSELPITVLDDEPAEMVISGDVLVVLHANREDTHTFSTWSGVALDVSDFYFYRKQGLAPAPELGRVFANVEYRPGYFEVGPYGQLGSQVYSYSTTSLYTETTWLSPDSSYLVYDSGELFFSDDLEPLKDLGGAVDDLVFYGDVPVVLRNDRLIAYSPAFLRTGEVDPGVAARRIRVHGDEIAVFHLGVTGIEAVWVPVADLEPTPPGQPADPSGLAFSPEDAVVDDRGIVYLLSRTYQSVFRFSTDTGSFLETIPTAGRAEHVTYSPLDDRLFIGYDSGAVGVVELDPGGNPSPETAHLVVSPSLDGLASASEFFFTAAGKGSDVTLRTHDASGAEVSQSSPHDASPSHCWASATRRMYRIDLSPERLFFNPIDAGGVIGAEASSGSGFDIDPPIRISADGASVLLGSGGIFDGASLLLTDEIGTSHLDAVWAGDEIVTLRENGGSSRLTRYDDSLSIVADITVPGQPERLFSVGADLLLLSSNPAGRPAFSTWNHGLDSDDLSVFVTDGEDHITAGEPLSYTISVAALGSGTTSGLTVSSEPSDHLTGLAWTCVATPPSACGAAAGAGAVSDTATVGPGGSLDYAVTATVDPSAVGTTRHAVRVEPPAGRAWEDADLTEIIDPLEAFTDGFEDGTTDRWTVVSP